MIGSRLQPAELDAVQSLCHRTLSQNWLEGVDRPAAAAHFQNVLAALVAGGFVTDWGRPTRALRQAPDWDAA